MYEGTVETSLDRASRQKRNQTILIGPFGALRRRDFRLFVIKDREGNMDRELAGCEALRRSLCRCPLCISD